MTMLEKPAFSRQRTLSNALSTSAALLSVPQYFLSNEPVFAPTRMGTPCIRAASATFWMFCSLPMLPGLMRTLSAPASIAAIAMR